MPFSIQDKTLPAGDVGNPYDFKLSATGGEGRYTWTAAPLPNPLKCRTDGTITGTPDSPYTGTVLIQVTDSNQQTASKYLNLFIRKPPLSIATTALPNGTVGSPYTGTLSAKGGTKPYVWSIAGGVLPLGLALNAASGSVTGVPLAVGVSSFTVTATDAIGATATAPLKIDINAGSGGWATLYETKAVFGNALLGFLDGIFVCFGGYPTATWTSSNGKTWVPISGASPNLRNWPVMVYGGGQLWLIGSDDNLNFCVFTFDLKTCSWRQVTQTRWGGAGGYNIYFSVTWFKGALWAIGGRTNSGVTNAIWTSRDGVAWIQQPNAPWPGREFAGACVFGSKLWIGGGLTSFQSAGLNDLWWSADGIAWTQAPAVPWTTATNAAPAWLVGTERTLYAMTCAGSPGGNWTPLMLCKMTSGGEWSPASAAGGLKTYNFLAIGLIAIGETLLAAVGTGNGNGLQVAAFCPKG